MDELAKDLNNALEEKPRCRTHKIRKGKAWKKFSMFKCASISVSSSVPRSSAVSDNSDSSFDHQIQHMNFSAAELHHQSDSDEVISKVNQLNTYALTAWRHCSTNMGESDSLNENFHPSREPRRKRKFKRMSIDPPSVAELEFQSVPNVPVFPQKNKRLRNLKNQKMPKLSGKAPKLSKLAVSQFSVEMENICRNFASATFCGKRKRCPYEKNFEYNGSECKGFLHSRMCRDEIYDCAYNCYHIDCDKSIRCQEINSSGVSSSDSEYDILTNDEGREADDEQSDFFHESGPSYGIPSVNSWWQDEYLMNDSDASEQQLNVDVQGMSESENRVNQINLYKRNSKQTHREIRSGRRRLEKEILATPVESELQNSSSCFSVKKEENSLKLIPSDKKRRKRMPPLSNSLHASDSFTFPVTDSSVGFCMLKGMGRKPVSSLESGGIASSVKPTTSRGNNAAYHAKLNTNVSYTSGVTSCSIVRNVAAPPLPAQSSYIFSERNGHPNPSSSWKMKKEKEDMNF